MIYEPGFNITVKNEGLGFIYGRDVFGPEVEIRYLDDIRASLRNPESDGPSELYAIAMDVGNKEDFEQIKADNLLFGVVTYAAGKIGDEPVRSQGHIHAISPSCNRSTPEVYEIWSGEAYIYMQESAQDNPGKCYAVHAKVGDVVIVPPNWAHATISANTNVPLTFGAWCVRDFGFEYADVRKHNGLAWFPIVVDDEIQWEKNPLYQVDDLHILEARVYDEFDIDAGEPIYTQYTKNPQKFEFVAQPQKYDDKWKVFKP